MDPIQLLVSEHRRIEKVFAKILDTRGAERASLFEDAADALAAHIAVEEQHFYPAVRARRTEDILLESLEEHLSLKRVMADLLRLSPDDAQWEPKLHVLEEQARHHHKEEEENLFPKVQKMFDTTELHALGDAMAKELDALRARHPRKRVLAETKQAATLDSNDVEPLSANA
jgi:hemerythrin superfamily protein